MPPKPSETDLELVTSDEEMELETEPYSSDDELEEEEEKETRDSGDDESVVDAEEFKKGKKSRRVVADTSKTKWIRYLMEELVTQPDYIQTKKKHREQISAALRKRGILKTEKQIGTAIKNYFYTGRKLPFPLNDEDVKNVKVIRERIAARSLNADWYGLLLEVLSNDPGLLENLNIEANNTIARRLLETHKIDKTGVQISRVIRFMRGFAVNGRVLPSLTTEKERQDYEKIAEKLNSTSGVVKSKWIRYLMEELVAVPDDYFQTKEKKKHMEQISAALRKRGILKTEKQIETAIRNYFNTGRKLPFPLNDEDVKNVKVIRERIAARPLNAKWIRYLMKELVAVPDDYFQTKEKKKLREEISAALRKRGILKTEKQIETAIQNYFYTGRKLPFPLNDEDVKNEKVLRERASARLLIETKSYPPKIRSRVPMAEVIEEVEDEAMLSETESYARVSTRNVVGGRIDKKKNKRNERRNASPMLSEDEDDEVEKEDEAMEQRHEEMLRELERAKEEVRAAEKEIERLRRIVKKEETVAAEKSVKEATVDGEAPFSVLSEADEIDLPKEQQHFVTLKGMTIGTENFLVTELIGAGTFGVVFRAVEKKTGNVCALKIVQTQGNDHLIVSELKFMRRMNNGGPMNKFLAPPSHSFTDMHKGVGFTAFQMDLLRVDLFSVVNNTEYEKKRFPPVAVLSILGQVFSALAYMNERGLVYSDIKPDNVMLKAFDLESSGDEELIVNPEIRLIDFNAVLDIDVRHERCQSARYRAPEVIFGYDFSEKIDSWSMGLLGLELLQKKLAMPIDYDEDDMVQEHIVRIEYLTGEEIPEKMWEPSRINMRELPPYVPDDQMSMAEILDDLEPSVASFALQHYIPRLLKIDPKDRPSPTEAAEGLKDAFPHP